MKWADSGVEKRGTDVGACASFIDTTATVMGRTFKMTVIFDMQWTLCDDAKATSGRTWA